MNRIVKTVLLTSLLMLVLLGGLCFLLIKNEKAATTEATAQARTELDMLYEGYEKINVGEEKDQIPLSMTGKNANVKTFTHKNIDQIYHPGKSSEILQTLRKWRSKEKPGIEQPLIAWNPFGTNNLSAYIYFPSNMQAKLRYTISVEDETIPDFTRTLYNGRSSGLTNEHEYQLIGFVPGRKNYLVLELLNKSEECIQKRVFSLNVPKLSSNAPVRAQALEGKSSEQMSNGLFFVCGAQTNSGKKNPYIWLYDNSGVLRGEIPIKDYRTDRIYTQSDEMIYSYGISNFTRVSTLGQVIDTYDISPYRQHHDYINNEYGSLWILATDPRKTNHATQDVMVSLSLKSGDVTKLLDFENLLPEKFKQSGSKPGNWLGLDSIQRTGSTDILVSSSKDSTIYKVANITSAVPKVSYLIADPDLWLGDKLSKKLLKKSSGEEEATEETDSEKSEETNEEPPFESQYGQNCLIVSMPAGGVTVSGEEGSEDSTEDTAITYDVSMFNNNYQGKKDGQVSYFYRYTINEGENSYTLKDKFQLPYSQTGGCAQSYGNRFICTCSDRAQYAEYDSKGVMVYQYRLKAQGKIWRVWKDNMKGFWFQ